MVGIGVLLAAPPGAPAPVTVEVQLASTESMFPLGPPDCLTNVEACGVVIGPSGSPAPTALAAASLDVGTLQLPPIIGPGGWLIGDGLDADPDCEAGSDACNGGNGGLLPKPPFDRRTASPQA